MIPRTIHYCWFGSNKPSKTIQNCIKSWEKHCPDYKIVLWNETNSPMQHPFVAAAYNAGKYAFAADYVRLWALSNYGGIYLDTDMLLLKNIDLLLKNTLFFGYESKERLNGSIIGSVKENEYMKLCIDYYNELKFDIDKMSEFAIPIIMTNIYNHYPNKETIQVYEPVYFYPYPFEARTSGDLNIWRYIKPESYCVHLWDASWTPEFKETLGEVDLNKVSFYLRIIKQNIQKIFK